MRLLLAKLNLKVNEEEQAVPSLSPLHLSSHTPADVADLVASWSKILTVVDSGEYIKGENDVFSLDKEGGAWGVQGLKRAVEVVGEKIGDALPKTLTGKEGDKDTENAEDEDQKAKKPKTAEEEICDRIAYTSSTTSDQILDYDKLLKSK